MSQLHSILNPESTRAQPEKLSVQTEIIDRLSSDDGEDISPTSDDEIDELDGESEVDDDDDPSPPPISHPSDHAARPTLQSPQSDRRQDRFTSRSDEKRTEVVQAPAPRRRIEKHDRKIDLGLHDHKAHADCPDTLACLPDTHGRPQHTLPVILRCAILGSPRKRLTIREIYASMELKYPYYKTAGQTWKQSVRHHLSLNRLFERQPRPVTDPGFGSYWTVNLSAPPGTKRPRKRGRPNKEPADGSSTKRNAVVKPPIIPPNTSPLVTKFQFQPQTHPAPPPPPIPQPQVSSISPRSPHPVHSPSHAMALAPRSQHQSLPQPPQGMQQVHPQQQHHQQRPNQPSQVTRQQHHRQNSTPLTPISAGVDSEYPPSSRDSDTEDGGFMTHNEDNFGPTISEDEFESEEEMGQPAFGNPRRQSSSGAFVPTNPSPIFSLPPFSTLDQNRESLIEHMRQEIATLRRTSAEAVSTSIRLSEQLANANLEVSRSREAVRDLEDMLQDEATKRKEAERLKEQETERRRAAEHALGNLSSRSPTRRPT